jgi:carboxy-cis,cis-muconate cyclase
LLFSVGGPTGEIHRLNPETGAIEEKLQEILFVPKDALENEDKSRKALVSFSINQAVHLNID